MVAGKSAVVDCQSAVILNAASVEGTVAERVQFVDRQSVAIVNGHRRRRQCCRMVARKSAVANPQSAAIVDAAAVTGTCVPIADGEIGDVDRDAAEILNTRLALLPLIVIPLAGR